MKERSALRKRDHLSTKPKSITDFRDRFEKVMKQVEKRAFQLFEERGRENGLDQEDWFKAEAELLTPVQIKITDAHKQLRIRVEIPGFESDDVTFNLEKNLLTIHGTKQTHAEKVTSQTKYSGSESKLVYRTVELPSEVIPEKAEAALKNGVLQIVVPKAASEPAKIIALSAA